MELQLKPTPWSCLATSFAMALCIPVAKFFELAGHDGSEIVRPLPDPQCRAGFHTQEAIDVCLKQYGGLLSITPIELFPTCYVQGGEHRVINFPEGNWERFRKHVFQSVGVIECVTAKGNGHAVACDSGTIYDPDEGTYSYDELATRGLYQQRLWIVG